MTKELEQQLYTKYPKIFAQKDLDCTVTCMNWGISCRDGWYNIIDNLCQQIQDYVDASNCDQIEATQVKQKFAGLRFYTNYSEDYIDNRIVEAEELSERTCEYCGSEANVGITSGWRVTCCETCAIKADIANRWKKHSLNQEVK